MFSTFFSELRIAKTAPNTSSEQGRIKGGGDWGNAPPESSESNFIHHDFLQFGKQHL